MQGDYEQIDIRSEMSRTDSEILSENITIPDGEDVYGGSSCICSCHRIEDPEFKSRHRHCIPCGIKVKALTILRFLLTCHIAAVHSR